MGPYVSAFAYCMELKQQGGTYSITQPVLMLTPSVIPSNYSFYIYCQIGGIDPQANKVKVILKDPDGNRLLETPEQTVATKDGGPSGCQMAIDVRNMLFKQEGRYITEVFAGGEKIQEFPIEMKVTRQSIKIVAGADDHD